MADKEKKYKVRQGRTFHGVVDGKRAELHGGDTVMLTEERARPMLDVFEEGSEDDKTSYRADTPDGNPDTTKVVTQGMGDGTVASPTIPPAAAGQAAPAPTTGKEAKQTTAPAEPVAQAEQAGGGSPNESSSIQAGAAGAEPAAPSGKK